MRLYKFGIIALVIVLWGCAADHEPEGTRGDGVTVSLTFDINVSGPGGSRANDDFSHGDGSEFAVDEACVALFAGDNEQDAEFVGAFRLVGDSETGQESGAPVSSVHRMRARVGADVARSDRQLFALAFVNYGGVMTLNEADGSLDFKGDGTFRPYTGQKASEMMTVQVSNATSRMLVNGRFFMTNAPMSDKPGGNTDPSGAKVHTLASINMEKISSPDEPCCHILVERGLAKLNVRFNPQILQDKLTVPGPDGTTKTLGIAYIEWWFDDPHCTGYEGENKASSYLVRNVGNISRYLSYSAGNGNNRYRFVGKTPLADYNDKNKAYRINWAIDPDYDADVKNSDYNIPHRNRIEWNEIGKDTELGTIIYMPENTFDVEHMNYRNSPRIIVRVQFTRDAVSDFAHIDGNADMCTLNGGKVLYSSAERTEILHSVVNKDAQFLQFVKASKLNEIPVHYLYYRWGSLSKRLVDRFVVEGGEPEIRYYNDSKGVLSNVYGYDDSAQKWIPGFEYKSDLGKHLTKLLGSMFEVNFYVNGYAYYEIRLKHFGDEYTPADGVGYGQLTAADAYGGNSAKYLGRYGMVRNNWYDVYINSIEELGEPHIPESTLPDDPRYNYPDDYEPAYMGVQINVLPWNWRKQYLKF